MRFEKVIAADFGPFHDQVLDLGPGFNLVFGGNEAGKSRWHAAMYAALCGVRRGRGARDRDSARFEELHRPWDGQSWRAGAIVQLGDGRRVEIQQELLGKVDCRAIDLGLGRDVSGEIISEGSPDGARWLGLDRRSFPSIACVRQADILGVVDADTPEALQEYLQRAAAAGRDTTAAEALQRLREFAAEHVGLRRAGARRPLQTATTERAAAAQALEQAAGAHRGYHELESRAENLREEARSAQEQLAAAHAAVAVREARELERRLTRARELLELHRSPPVDTPDREDASQDVTRALTLWRGRPQPIVLAAEAQLPRRAVLASPGAWWAGAAATAAIALYAGLRSPVLAVLVLAGAVLLALVPALLRFGRRRPGAPDPTRLQLEAAAADAELRIAEAGTALREAAARCGVGGETGAELAAGLEAWRAERAAERRRAAAAMAGWAELQVLLDGGDIAGLEATAARAGAAAADRSRGLDPEAIAAAIPSAEEVSRRDAAAQAARSAADDVRGRLEQAASQLPSLAEAEERLAAADAELGRVQRLDGTLRLTQTFLEGAQERVHRDIAPVLAASLASWLPRLTGGRYTDVIVDPATLQVQVCGPDRRWRRAALLSQGTAEQVYLLLRVAMADALTVAGEVCPLLLDDITVQFDAARTTAVLGLLHELSRDRQVVLFSQEDEVLDWAAAALDPARDRLVRLEQEMPAAQLQLYSDPGKLVGIESLGRAGAGARRR